ncbi:MAG: FHA domain-containing protein [Coleofasciculaceae cyanobacterium]
MENETSTPEKQSNSQELKILQDKSLPKLKQVITLTLLHPLQSIPVQSWPFESESVIRIGRSTDNEVVLYSAVVSRYHVELRHEASGWKVINLGANGTYIDGKPITSVPVSDGMIIRIASSGPKIQISLTGEEQKAILGKSSSSSKKTLDQSKDTFINLRGLPKEEKDS